MRTHESRITPAGLVALVVLAGCAKQADTASGPPDAQVTATTVSYPAGAPQLSYLTVETARARTLAVTHLTGRLFLADDATVRIFTPVAGQVSAVRAEVGQKVAKGDALADIDSPDFGQALSDSRTAAGAFAAAEQALGREKELLAHGAAAAKDVEAAQAAFVAAEAERDRTASRLALYHGSDSSSPQAYVLRSPLAGVVVERNLNPGQEVRADQMLANATNLFAPLFVVSDPTRLWLQIDASETDLAELQQGQAIEVVSKAFPGRVFKGTLANIAPSLDPDTRAVRVRGVVENPDSLLKAEMYVSVNVVRDESRVAGAGVDISSKAIVTIDQVPYVFVETAPGRFERRKVSIGQEKEGQVPILTGVSAGEKVVTEGGLLLEAVMDPAN